VPPQNPHAGVSELTWRTSFAMLNQSRADLGIPDESRLLELGIKRFCQKTQQTLCAEL